MQIALKIDGMTCLGCSRHVTQALERVPGVRSAALDYRAGEATINTDRIVPVDALTKAVERAGYHAGVVATRTSSSPDAAARNGAGGAAAPSAHLRGTTGTPSFASEPAACTVPSPPSRGDGSGLAAADFDLLVVGTGGAGMAAAIRAAGMGGKVAIVEAATVGGTCVNVGCIPSKSLIEAAAHYHAARAGFPGVGACEPTLDWGTVVGHTDALVTELRQAKYLDVLASYPGVARVPGAARLVGRAGSGVGVRVRVMCEHGGGAQESTLDYTVRKVVIATGTTPARPSIPGLDDVGALDSSTAMQLDALPESMIVLGGGPVGVELGQMFARFGTRVVIVQRGAQLLPQEDADIADALRGFFESEGIEVHTGTRPTGVKRDGAQVVLSVAQGALTGELRAGQVLLATGRRPNTDGLGLEDAGVTVSDRGYVQVDTTMRTSNPDIYAAGDVTGGPGYVYVAAAGGRVAAENAMRSLAPTGTSSDDPRELDLAVVPSVTFSAPQVASVGLTEGRARALGLDVQVAMLPMAQVPRALVSRDTRGVIKIVAEAGSGKLIGIHAVAPNAGELMGEAALAIRLGLTASDLSGTLHPYLTWGESVKLAAQGFSMDVSKLSCCA